MSWIASVLLVTPDALRAAAAQTFAAASGNPADAAPEVFGIPLTSASAPGDVTHWACHTRVRAATLAALPQIAALIPGSLWHVTEHDADGPGWARHTALDFLAAHDLALYTPPDEDTP